MINKTKSQNVSFPHLSLLPTLNFTSEFSSSFLPEVQEWGLQSGYRTSSLLLLLPQGEGSSHFSSSPAWGQSHSRESSTSFSNLSPSHGLQFFTYYFTVGPFHGVQFFRNRLPQFESPAGSQILPGNLLHHVLLSPCGQRSCGCSLVHTAQYAFGLRDSLLRNVVCCLSALHKDFLLLLSVPSLPSWKQDAGLDFWTFWDTCQAISPAYIAPSVHRRLGLQIVNIPLHGPGHSKTCYISSNMISVPQGCLLWAGITQGFGPPISLFRSQTSNQFST